LPSPLTLSRTPTHSPGRERTDEIEIEARANLSSFVIDEANEGARQSPRRRTDRTRQIEPDGAVRPSPIDVPGAAWRLSASAEMSASAGRVT